MNAYLHNVLAFVTVSLFGLATPVQAGPGHDHGPTQSTNRPASLPRATMLGDYVEAIATLQNQTMALYVNYAANNMPVKQASIQVSVNGVAMPWSERASGVYITTLSQESMAVPSLQLKGLIEANGLTDAVAGIIEHIHDHDHEEGAKMDMPFRDADGSVFFPKASQLQLGLRAQSAKAQEVPITVALNGKVAIEPHTGGLVQTITGGHFEATASGVPKLGQPVKKGQILGYLHTHASPLEEAANRAEIAKLQADVQVAQQRLSRLEKLTDSVPRKAVEAARSDLASLRGQLSALQRGLEAREPLTAPTQGVIASSKAISGKVFNPGDIIFEVVNPTVLRVEADWYEPGAAPSFDRAFLAGSAKTIQLEYEGAAGSLINQSMTLVFEAHFDTPQAFAIGQLLTVYAQTTATRRGIPLPRKAMVKNTANQTIVWVKTAAEQMVPKVVVTEPYNGEELLVVNGLQVGERVITDGANLVNQVR